MDDETPHGHLHESRFRYKGVWVEPAWQVTTDVDHILDTVLAGESDDHSMVVLAEAISHCIPLRPGDKLTEWQSRLQHYPDALQAKLIGGVIEHWISPIAAEVRWALIRRGQYRTFTESMFYHMTSVIRVLFAVNREWEPDSKWIAQLQSRLTVKPSNLMDRINTVLLDPEPEVRLVTALHLMLDTLALVPPAIDVSAARRVLSQSLRDNGAGLL